MEKKDEAKGTRVDPTQPLYIDFKYEPWNKDPKAPDSAVLFIRNAQTNSMVKATLTEDGNNTNLFKGQFTITWKSEGAFQADIYSPPQDLAKKDGNTTIEEFIKEGTLPRKPYFLRKEKGQQKLTIYNSGEQALEAYSVYKQTLLGLRNVGAPIKVPTIDNGTIATARSAEIAAEFARLAKAALDRDKLRQQKEQEERLRQAELERQQNLLAAAEKQKKIAQAKDLSDRAIKLYVANNYKEAEPLFRQSIDLDPSNKSYFFQYGATLYRNKKYDEALIALKFAVGPETNTREKAYFQGLCHLKLKEYKSALEEFSLVTSVIDDTLNPSASFYTGVIYFGQEKYSLAKIAFEKTLDLSSDPKLDESAENYIEQIANIQQFQAKLSKRFTASASTGLIYDSNILMASNSSSNAATEKAGFRTSFNANLDTRIIYTPTQELHTDITYSDLYSFDTNFKSNASFQMADSQVMTIKFPYKWKGELLGKPYQISAAPGYESLNLNIDSSGSRENIMATTLLSTEQTFVINSDYITLINLDWRGETAKVDSPGITNATKISLSNSNMHFLNSKKSEAALWTWGYLLNQANSDNLAFGKMTFSGGYIMPLGKAGSWMNLLNYSSSNFSKSSTSRKDTNLLFNTNWSTPINEDWKTGVAISFETNQSTIEAYTYNKYTLTATLGWNLDF